MELTPIRIPGKRRQKGAPPLVFVTRKKDDDGTRKKKRQKTTAKARKPKASYLERQLPLEIVERIFWASENVNFARSGPRVGQLLSGASTRRETFLRAFAPTWDVWFGCARGGPGEGVRIASYHDWRQDAARFGGNPEFQSALLQYSWVDVSFILSCMDSWAHRNARDRFFQPQKLWGDSAAFPLPENEDDGGIGAFASAGRYFEHDYDAFRANLDLDLPALAADEPPGWVEVHCETQIPEGLLTGPWDEEAARKLFWLFRAGARLSADQTWETTLEGFHNAMRAGPEGGRAGTVNMPVVRMLLLLAGNHWPAHVASAEIDKLKDKAHELVYSQDRDAYDQNAHVVNMLEQKYPATTTDT